MRKDKSAATTVKTKLEEVNKDLREVLKDLKMQPKRISKKYVGNKLAAYYKEHPKCKSPMFVYASVLQDAREAELDELEKQDREAKAGLSSANRYIRRLEREALEA